MKTLKIKYLSVLLVLLSVLWSSCTKEIAFSGGDLEPKLVINAICSLDSTIVVEISASKAIPGFENKFRFIPDATVKLFVGGKEIEQLVCSNAADSTLAKLGSQTVVATYTGESIIKSGNEYRIEVSHPDFERKATVEMIAGTQVAVENVSVNIVTNTDVNDYSDQKIDAVMKFTDPAEEENYYCLNLSCRIGDGYTFDDANGMPKTHVTVTDYYSKRKLESSDPVISNSADVDNVLFETSDYGYTLFTDELFNGKTNELSFEVNESMVYDLVHTDTTMYGFYILTFELQSLSKDVYYYLKALNASYSSEMGLFAEPVQTYCNVENGLGICGLCSSSTFQIQYGKYPVDGVTYSYGMVGY